jgi:hypothetical protein
MSVTQIDLVKRLNGSGTNPRFYARSNGAGLWVPTDPLANPTFVDAVNPLKQVQFDLSAMSVFANIVFWDSNGMSGDSISYAEKTLTTTGNIDDLDPTIGIQRATLIRMNNASLATIRGLAGGWAGHRYIIQSVGAGQVDIAHQNAGSIASNRIVTPGGISLSLAAGTGVVQLIHDVTINRWRVLDFDQGGVILYTPTWTSTGTAPALGNGTISGFYYRVKNIVFFTVDVTFGSTSTYGTGGWVFTLPPIAMAGAQQRGGTCLLTDSGVNVYTATMLAASTVNFGCSVPSAGRVSATQPFTFGTGDGCRTDGWYTCA